MPVTQGVRPEQRRQDRGAGGKDINEHLHRPATYIAPRVIRIIGKYKLSQGALAPAHQALRLRPDICLNTPAADGAVHRAIGKHEQCGSRLLGC